MHLACNHSHYLVVGNLRIGAYVPRLDIYVRAEVWSEERKSNRNDANLSINLP